MNIAIVIISHWASAHKHALQQLCIALHAILNSSAVKIAHVHIKQTC